MWLWLWLWLGLGFGLALALALALTLTLTLTLTRAQVRLKAGGLKGAIVAVLEAEAAYDVTMSESAKTERVAHAEVEVVQPGKKEKLIIISGEHKGSTGTLIGIDGLDGIVKMQANGDIKILDLQSCAKLN